MGLIGVICALEAQTGNEDATIKFLIMSGFCIAGILLVKGTLGFINKVKYIFGSKVNCAVSIMAECSNVVKNVHTTNDIVTSVIYTPTYRFTFGNQEYAVTSLPTASCREEGNQYEIFINHEKPSAFYDPVAEDKDIKSIIPEALLHVVFSALLLLGGIIISKK